MTKFLLMNNTTRYGVWITAPSRAYIYTLLAARAQSDAKRNKETCTHSTEQGQLHITFKKRRKIVRRINYYIADKFNTTIN